MYPCELLFQGSSLTPTHTPNIPYASFKNQTAVWSGWALLPSESALCDILAAATTPPAPRPAHLFQTESALEPTAEGDVSNWGWQDARRREFAGEQLSGEAQALAVTAGVEPAKWQDSEEAGPGETPPRRAGRA